MKSVKSLAIVSHVTHYEWMGSLYAYGPYVREIDIWADIFPHIIIASPARKEKPPSDCLPFCHANIRMIPQLQRGGTTWQAKFSQIFSLPILVSGLCSAMLKADAIHVRCPGNLGLLGVILAPLFSRYRVAKYAGQWTGYEGEAWSYRLQRALLRSQWWKAPVTVYGAWPDQPAHIKPFFTSVMDKQQVRRAVHACAGRQMHDPLRVIFVGRLSHSKNVHVLLAALGKLAEENISVDARIIGDGPELPALQQQCAGLPAHKTVITFMGGMSFEDVLSNYEWADVLVLASETEGWPKAIAEGMAFGLVCIGSNRGLVPQMLADQRGLTVEPGDAMALASALQSVATRQVDFQTISSRAAEWSQQYSLDGLKAALRALLIREWQLSEDEL